MNVSRRQFLGTTAGAASLSTWPGGPATAALPAAEGDDPLGVRADFPVVQRGVYLNSAYIAPNPLRR